MPAPLRWTAMPWCESYSEVVDGRSPSEYADDHLPGAINLPVLTDAQRAEVGTLHQQVSGFEARKRGAAYVAANIATHLHHHFATKPADYHPLIYCWRGGMRSHSFALVLQQIGWSVTLIEGGYKTYRAHVRDQLTTLPTRFQFRILCGLTGSGKTKLLHHLAQSNPQAQVLDLEAIAHHHGSLLGREPHQPQPSQKRFDSILHHTLSHFDPAQPVWVEAESHKIGTVYLPPALWHQMQQGTCIELYAPLTARVDFLLATYPHLTQQPDFLKTQLARLQRRYGRDKITQWNQWIDAAQWPALIADLLITHYDPSYATSMARHFPPQAHRITLTDLSTGALQEAARQLCDRTFPRSEV
ncbi:tRNA 2-selenouridine(34) synthase MnmH [Spirulina major]|uniref:tRNA 2-selenouridine(34) synthase MnmH n=1 Tax=Spirulina major TaxID=270636 RepID=UPI000934539D|nr:tRNA 2-selenouridine(34) synthase MnmH [Spirulina major]